MSRLVLPILIVALGMEWLGSGCLHGQTPQRKMLYDSRVAIADRLLPHEKEIFVYKEVASPGYTLDPSVRQTYEQETQRLRLGDIIALVRVATVQGELVEEGTWIQTNVVAQVDRLVQSGLNKPLGNSVEFTFTGGNTRIGDVGVTAGSFPQFIQGEQYLVFLVTRPRVTLGLVYHVNARGVLEHVRQNTGVEQSFQTNLIGRDISEVLEALTPAK